MIRSDPRESRPSWNYPEVRGAWCVSRTERVVPRITERAGANAARAASETRDAHNRFRERRAGYAISTALRSFESAPGVGVRFYPVSTCEWRRPYRPCSLDVCRARNYGRSIDVRTDGRGEKEREREREKEKRERKAKGARREFR
ncbi:hypothetical protein ALC62_03357 [Cyphomyrmex costatus]|uniref:Uncharacterized protein n=1 Tax=Cyphomyrmex costatus TaxID=456900 RepID=A0A195CYQ2_9HYME|nr:hypothetical protein ALC62_03357 [Cyphomyrmex costatus]